jgi:hypothetical protein
VLDRMKNAIVLLGLLSSVCTWPRAPEASSNTPAIFPSIRRFLAQAREREVPVAQLSGVVTHSYRQSSVYIRDATGGVFVSSPTNPPLKQGDLVTVTGSSVRGGFSPILRQTSLRLDGQTNPPAAIEATVKDIAGGKHEMELIRIEGTLLEVSRREDRTIYLRLLDGSMPFTAELDREEMPKEWDLFLPQSRARVTGICRIGGEAAEFARAFRVLMRSPADAVLVQTPPWWTFDRTLRLIMLLALLILGGLIWVANVEPSSAAANG